MIAWAFDRAALGAPPEGVELAAELGPDVEFAVVHWEDLRALEGLSGLRVLQTVSAGVDWIVDRVPEGVTLCSARGARDRAMAEWVMAAILADAKRARECAEQQGRRHWELVKLGDASGLRVLVLGFGSIGRTLAAMLVPFDCEVVGVARRARDGVHGSDELPALLPGADVVVNLLPLTEATRGASAPASSRPCARARSTSTPGAARRPTPRRSSPRCRRGASAPCSTSSIPSRCPPTIRCGRRRA